MGRLDWKKPLPLWSLPVAVFLAVSLTTAFLIVPNLLAPRPDFALVPKSQSLTVIALNCFGRSGPCNGNSTLLSLKPLGNFTGIVSIYATGSNPGITVDIGKLELPNKILLGPATDVPLSVASDTIGNYTVTITASSGPIIHTLVVPVAVQNITFTLSSTSLTIARGSTGTVQMDMASVNRLAGNLTMRGSVPLGSFGGTDPNVNVSFSPPSLLLQPGASARTIVTVSVAPSAGTGPREVDLAVYKGATGFGLVIHLTIT